MFAEYKTILVQFHQTLIHKDQDALRALLADSARTSLDQEFHPLDQVNLPLSDDIEVTGISLEGSGEIITVYYINRVADQELSMVAYLKRVGEAIKLNHFLPQLKN
jgi:hypothetical protein